MAEAVGQGYVYTGNVAAIDTFKDGTFIRAVHVEDGNKLVFTTVESQDGDPLYVCDCWAFGVTFIFDFSLELSSFDGRVVAFVNCFSNRAPGGNRRHVLPIKTDYYAVPEVRFGEG
jgi:hypothetical protein